MNKRALMLTAAATALLSGQAFAANPNPPCSTSTSIASPQLCDITSSYGDPIFTGTNPPTSSISTSAGGLGNVTIESDGVINVGLNPPEAPAVTINSGTAASPTIVTNAGQINMEGNSYTVGTLLEEASVPTSASSYGTAENWTGEYVSTGSGVMNLTGNGTNKVGILIAGGANYTSSSSSTASTTSVYSDAATGLYPNSTGTNSPLGVFTGGNVLYNGSTAGTSNTPIAVDIASGSSVQVQGTSSYGIELIGPTFSTTGTGAITPSGGGTLIGDIVVGGSIEMTPASTTSTSATGNAAILIAGWEPTYTNSGTTESQNPALVALGYTGQSASYAMIGNINVQSGGTVSSVGEGAQGIVVLGPVNGAISNSGSIIAEGTTTPSAATNADNPEGGSALIVANNVTGGIFNSGSANTGGSGTSTATGSISTIGTSPTIWISPSALTSVNAGAENYTVPITIGTVANDQYVNQFSLLNRGTISASAESGDNSTTAIDIAGAGGAQVTLQGGIFNSGTITATAATNTQTATSFVTATAIDIGDYTKVGTSDIFNSTTGQNFSLINSGETQSGRITATVSGPDYGVAYGVLISAPPSGDPANGATLTSLFNSGTISASATTSTLTLTTNGTATEQVAAYAIDDLTGTLNSILNEGTISATATTLDDNAQIADAIDISANSTTPVTITDQSEGSTSATITGDVHFGSMLGTLIVTGLNTAPASVVGDIFFNSTGGGGNDALTINSYGTVTGEVQESSAGSVDITIAPAGRLNLLTTLPTNLNSTVSAAVTAGKPLSVGTLNVSGGGVLNESLSQGYNVNVYAGTSIITANSATIGNAISNIQPLQITFGSFIASPVTKANPTGTATFVLLQSNSINISSTELAALNTSIQTNQSNQIPYLFSGSICSYNVTPSDATSSPIACSGTEPNSSTASEIVLNLTPKSATALGLTGYANTLFPHVNEALINDPTLGAAMVNGITNQQTAEAAYSSFTPDVTGATRATAISLTDSSAGPVAARQRELTMFMGQEGETTLWGQQFGQRLSQNNTSTLPGYNDAGWGFVLGADEGDRADGRYGLALTFFSGDMSEKEPISAKTRSEYYLLTGYTNWRGKGLFLNTQATVGYGNLKGNRYLNLYNDNGDLLVSRDAQNQRPSELLAGSVTTGVVMNAGGTVFIPQASLDGLTMREEGYTESNGGPGFDLRIQPYYAESLRASAGADIRQDVNFGDFFLQPDLRVAYRYDFVNGAVKLKANFASVNSTNDESPDPFEIKGPDPGHSNLVLGGGVATTTGAWSIGLNYDYVRAGSGATEQVGMLNLLGRI